MKVTVSIDIPTPEEAAQWLARYLTPPGTELGRALQARGPNVQGDEVEGKYIARACLTKLNVWAAEKGFTPPSWELARGNRVLREAESCITELAALVDDVGKGVSFVDPPRQEILAVFARHAATTLSAIRSVLGEQR